MNLSPQNIQTVTNAEFKRLLQDNCNHTDIKGILRQLYDSVRRCIFSDITIEKFFSSDVNVSSLPDKFKCYQTVEINNCSCYLSVRLEFKSFQVSKSCRSAGYKLPLDTGSLQKLYIYNEFDRHFPVSIIIELKRGYTYVLNLNFRLSMYGSKFMLLPTPESNAEDTNLQLMLINAYALTNSPAHNAIDYISCVEAAYNSSTRENLEIFAAMTVLNAAVNAENVYFFKYASESLFQLSGINIKGYITISKTFIQGLEQIAMVSILTNSTCPEFDSCKVSVFRTNGKLRYTVNSRNLPGVGRSTDISELSLQFSNPAVIEILAKIVTLIIKHRAVFKPKSLKVALTKLEPSLSKFGGATAACNSVLKQYWKRGVFTQICGFANDKELNNETII